MVNSIKGLRKIDKYTEYVISLLKQPSHTNHKSNPMHSAKKAMMKCEQHVISIK